MAYVQPTFNLLADVYGISGGIVTFRLQTLSNLALGRRVNFPVGGVSIPGGSSPFYMSLLVPALTDIRDQWCTPGVTGDVVEVPSGSGRWYYVNGVDDIGKGFPNEHRVALLVKAGGGTGWAPYGIPYWPAPIP